MVAWRALGLALALAVLGVAGGRGGEKTRPGEKRAGELKLTTERVIVFKDGYCLFVKRAVGTVSPRGEVFTEEVPNAAVLGSFWATPRKGRLVSMTAGLVTTTEKTEKSMICTRHLEILKANKGKTCAIETNDKALLRGTIREVLVQETQAPAPKPMLERFNLTSALPPRAYRSAMPARPAPTATLSGISGSLFVLRTEDGDVLLPVSHIRALTIKDMKLSDERMVTTRKTAKRLTFRFDKGGGKRDLLLMYFCPGVRWIPTYRVELAPEDAKKKMARIALQAEILNEVEDIEGVPLDLVVGVPNFRFRNVVSPFSLEGTLRNALQQAAPQLMGQFRNDLSNALFTQRAGERRGRRGAARAPGGGTVTLPAELTAGGSQDLFIYNLPKLTIRKGHRAAVPIFDATAPYRDVYTWEVHLQRHDVEAAPSGSGMASPLSLSRNQVWHQVELTNNSKVPWTTGAAMFMQDGRPLAQELLTYTSPGGTVRIPVTVSVDTRGSYTEKETGRTLKALRWMHRDYARIEKKGTLVLSNSKVGPIEAEVVCRFGGHADEASDDGKITLGAFDSNDWKNYHGHPAVNNHSRVFWKIRIEPGKTATLTVKYHYFTRHD